MAKMRWSRVLFGVGVIALLVLANLAALPSGAKQVEPALSPEEVTEGFYEWYFSYIGDRSSGQGRNPLVDGAYRDSEYLTPAFVDQVDALIASFDKGGYDPFLCAQDIPERLTVDEALVTDDHAAVMTNLFWMGNPMVSHTTVTLRQVEGAWMIDGVACSFELTMQTPVQTVESFYKLYLDYTGRNGGEMRNPLVDKAYQRMPFLSPEFVNKVDGILASFDKGGYDPILCAQDVPEWVRAEEVAREGQRATVEVTTSFEGHTFEVELAQQGEEWLIVDVRRR